MSKDYQPMICPICKGFYFSELQEGDDVEKLYCHHCGWRYSLKQRLNPQLENDANRVSLEEYKKWYESKITENPEFDYFEENKALPKQHKCPVCGRFNFKDESCHDVCPYCGWEDDGTEDSNIIGANSICFTDYREQYKSYLASHPDYKWKKDGNL